MLKPPICGLLALLLSCKMLKAQDTLINELEAAREDTNKVMLYWKTGAGIIYQNTQAAMKHFRSGAELAKKLNYTSGAERCLGAISFAYSNLSKYDSALVYINLAIPYAKKAGELKRLTLAYINRADVHTNLYRLSDALKDCDTAIQYAEKMTGNSDALGRITGLMAEIYLEQKQYTAAEMNMDRSIRYFERTTNRRLVAQSYSDKADLYNLLEQPEKALPLLNEAIRIGDSLDDKQNLAAYYGSLSESLAKLKRYDEARQAARRGIDICIETGNTRQQAVMYTNLGEIEHRTKNTKLAIDYAEKSFHVFKEENDTLRQQIAASNLAEFYQAVNNNTKAYEYLKISKEFGDSLTRRQFSEETTKLQTTYEVKEKDKEILLLNKEKELQNQRLLKQRFIAIGAVLIALLGFAGVWLLYNRNKLRQGMKELELRNRIAADLHDEVGSSLSSIHMLSQMASQRSDGGTSNDILTRMSTNARETMEKMGDIVWMIKPSDTEAGSLKHRMERFAYEVGISKNIEVSVELSELEKLKLNMEQRRNIYLICKEAVNNAAKYSETGKISITSSVKNRELQLVIEDEGKGFDHSKTRRGNGLENMNNRAAELGGRLEIGSVANEGTTVKLVIPA